MHLLRTANDSTPAAGPVPSRRHWPRSLRIVGGGLLAVSAALSAGCGGGSTPAAPVAQSVATAGDSKASAPASHAVARPAKAAAHQNAARGADGRLGTTPVAGSCANCGVVEAVRPLEVKGQGTGLGAVAGAVAGGVLGHQMGGGDGKRAMTVLGAIGGGLAGNEVEKRARAETMYEVQVRMDDQSLRTVRLAQAPKPGERVSVDGDKLRSLAAPGAAAPDAPRMMETKARSGSGA